MYVEYLHNVYQVSKETKWVFRDYHRGLFKLGQASPHIPLQSFFCICIMNIINRIKVSWFSIYSLKGVWALIWCECNFYLYWNRLLNEHEDDKFLPVNELMEFVISSIKCRVAAQCIILHCVCNQEYCSTKTYTLKPNISKNCYWRELTKRARIRIGTMFSMSWRI